MKERVRSREIEGKSDRERDRGKRVIERERKKEISKHLTQTN